MHNKKIKKFSKRTGIVNVDHDNENWFVVYSYLFDLPKLSKHELGTTVGKGKTSEQALIEAIVNLTDQIIKLQKFIDNLEEKISKINRKLPRESNKIILAVHSFEQKWNEEKNRHEYVATKEKYNADILIDENGSPCVGFA